MIRWKYSAIEMKRTLFLIIQVFCFTAGFAQNPPWKANGYAITARTNLNVDWQASTKFPKKVWSYQLLPNRFSPEIISNAMTLCSFTPKDEVESDTNGIAFESANHSRTLSISFSSGEIDYETRETRYSPTNLAVGVPQLNELPTLAKKLFRELHISFSDVTGYFDTNKIDYVEPALTYFYVGEDVTITNIPYRTILFKRIVDGLPIAHQNCRFNIGEQGKLVKILITWPNLKRIKSYRMVSPKDVINFLRNGNAVRGPTPTDIGDFDWHDVKGVTITKAIPSYLASNGQLYPFLRMDVTINLGGQDVKMAMDCPITK